MIGSYLPASKTFSTKTVVVRKPCLLPGQQCDQARGTGQSESGESFYLLYSWERFRILLRQTDLQVNTSFQTPRTCATVDSADSASRLASRNKAVHFTHKQMVAINICIDLRWVSKRWNLCANLSRLTNNASRRKVSAFRVSLSRALRTWPAGSYFEIPARFFGTHERQRETFSTKWEYYFAWSLQCFIALRSLEELCLILLNTLFFKLVSHSGRLTAVVRPKICFVFLNFLSAVSPIHLLAWRHKNSRGGWDVEEGKPKELGNLYEDFMVASRWYGLFDHLRIKPICPLHRAVNTSLYTLNDVIRGNALLGALFLPKFPR